jgi:hypothetical protein
VDKLDDEGMLELPSEEQMYSVLGLKNEDKTKEQEREGRRCGVSSSTARKGVWGWFNCHSDILAPKGDVDVW